MSFACWVQCRQKKIKKQGVRYLRVFGRTIEVVPPVDAKPRVECPGYRIEATEYDAGCRLTKRDNGSLTFDLFCLVDGSIETLVVCHCDAMGNVTRWQRFDHWALGLTAFESRRPQDFLDALFNEAACAGEPVAFDLVE
jgi:hypothetical protein